MSEEEKSQSTPKSLMFNEEHLTISTEDDLQNLFKEHFGERAEEFLEVFRSSYIILNSLFTEGGILDGSGAYLMRGIPDAIIATQVRNMLFSEIGPSGELLEIHGVIKIRAKTIKTHLPRPTKTGAVVFLFSQDFIHNVQIHHREQRTGSTSVYFTYKGDTPPLGHWTTGPFSPQGPICRLLRGVTTSFKLDVSLLPAPQLLKLIVVYMKNNINSEKI